MSLPEIKVTGRVLTLSKSTLARNASLGAGATIAAQSAAAGGIPGVADVKQPRPQSRIRQAKEPKLNKLEREGLEWLKGELGPIYRLQPHAIRLRLANGCHYTPDIIGQCHLPQLPGLRAWEVKGEHAWDDSIVKLKVAASTWPQIRFTLIWKDGEGQWQQQEVLP